MTKHRLEGLEFLRALCALVVMLNHVWGEGIGLPQYSPVIAIYSYSIEAVMGFFVLSGCVISLQDYADTGRYVRARLVRLLPVYYATLALAVVGMALCGVDYTPSQLIGNLLFLQTQDWKPLDPLRFFIPSWSLSYEFYYYVVFIAIMAAPRLLLPLLAASIVVGGGLYFVPKPAGPALWLLHVFSFFGMWLAGVLITRLYRRGHAVSIGTGAFMLMIGFCLARVSFTTPSKFDYFRLACFSLGFAIFVWSMLSRAMLSTPDKRKSFLDLDPVARGAIAAAILALFWRASDSFMSTKIVLTVGVVVFTLFPATLASWVTQAMRPLTPVMLYIAGLSYALYLVHYPLVQTFNSLHLLPPIPNLIMVCLLSFGLAHLLEYRLQFWVRGRLINSKPSPASASSSSIRT